MKQVWLLWGSDTEKPWVEQVFVDKVMAEFALRHMKITDDGRGYIYWIQEKEITDGEFVAPRSLERASKMYPKD